MEAVESILIRRTDKCLQSEALTEYIWNVMAKLWWNNLQVKDYDFLGRMLRLTNDNAC